MKSPSASVRLLLLRVFFVYVGVTSFLGNADSASIRVGVANTPLSTPFFVADKMGYFRDEGLDIVMIDCPSGGNCLKQMLDSKVQLATASDLPIMFRSFESVPFRILATFAISNNDVKLLTRKSAGIQSSRDLKGKRVALLRGSSGQYLLDLTLLAAGLDPRSATIVDVDVNRLSQAASDPQIDAFALFQPGAQQMSKLLGSEAFVIPIPRLYTLTFNLVTLRDRTGVTPDDLVKLLRALERAMDYIKAEPNASMRILQERFKMDASDIAELWPDFRFALSLNQSLIASLESAARWAIQEELVKARVVPNYLEYIDVRPLKLLRPARVTVVK
jgi:ABC-type nitrate/sulfonate/bicarbonate transport system substrate-binding protein